MKNSVLLIVASLFSLFGPSALAIDAGRSLYIEVYPNEISYEPGDEAAFHISTTSPTYSLEIKRLGVKPTIVHEEKKIGGGQEYGVPENASAKGCGWPIGYRVKISDSWKSGYYVMTLKISDSGGKFSQWNRRTAESQCYFIVRPKNPGTDSKILLQLATNTYNAYNNWGGSSLYGFHGRAGLQGHEVSFHRPQRTLFSRWEADFVTWAETNGYALDYCSNLDLQLRPDIVKNYKLVLSIGHDEYWSGEMRDTIENYIADGGNVAFLSGNTCCWQVRWDPESQSLTSWKQWFNQDPLYAGDKKDHAKLATLWGHHLLERPENTMTGVGFLHGGYHRSHGQFMDGTGAFKVHRPGHWLFAGTDLKRDAEFGGNDTIVGYECDGCEIEWRDGLPFPTSNDGTPKNFEILATCPAQWAAGDSVWYEKWPSPDHQGNAVFGTYQSDKGGTVVTTGTTDWVHGLKGGDKDVIQITKNILERLAK